MIKKEYLDSVVTYTQGRRSITVKLSEATKEQLKKIREIYPEYFEKDVKAKD